MPADELPLDSDTEVDDAPAVGVRIRPTLAALGLVWLGGAAGTALRFLLGRVLPAPAGLPAATGTVNVAGALLLGLLLERLAARPVRRGRALRLLLGTGFLGGFTTYSALTVDTVGLLARPGWAMGYATGTLLLGGLATLVGIRLGRPRSAR